MRPTKRESWRNAKPVRFKTFGKGFLMMFCHDEYIHKGEEGAVIVRTELGEMERGQKYLSTETVNRYGHGEERDATLPFAFVLSWDRGVEMYDRGELIVPDR